jgi:hypothetical protein
MKLFNGHHRADFTVTEDVEITGLITGSVIVPPGKLLVLRGMVTGDVVVQKGAQATIYGMISGTLTNQGGIVRVAGQVNSIADLGDAKTTVEPHAKVGPPN